MDRSHPLRAHCAARSPSSERRLLLRAAVAFGTALVVPSARACEVQVETLTVVHPWVRASGPGADSAIISMTFKDVLESDRLLAARTSVAEGVHIATPSGAVDIPVGLVTHVTEEGAEVRLYGLRMPLQMGRQFPLTLEFEKGGSVRTALSVDFVFR